MDVNAPEFTLENNEPAASQSASQLYTEMANLSLTPDYHLLQTAIVDIGTNVTSRNGVSSLHFDNQEELLWMGNSSGHLTSYYTYGLDKYTSFHIDFNSDIRDTLTTESGILSLTQTQLRLSIRRGLTVFTHKSELLQNMQCMTMLQSSGLLLMGGHQEQMIELDLERMKQVRITSIAEGGCVVMRQHPKFICSGSVNGKVCYTCLSSF